MQKIVKKILKFNKPDALSLQEMDDLYKIAHKLYVKNDMIFINDIEEILDIYNGSRVKTQRMLPNYLDRINKKQKLDNQYQIGLMNQYVEIIDNVRQGKDYFNITRRNAIKINDSEVMKLMMKYKRPEIIIDPDTNMEYPRGTVSRGKTLRRN